MDLKDKVALVTGGARGIGKTIAEILSKAGAKVVLNDLDLALAEAAAAEIRQASGNEVLGLQGNVTNAGDVEAIFNKALDKFNRLDVLVNNAGITKDNLILRMTEEAFDAVIAVNLKGTFLCTKAAAKIMMKQRAGSIISISSVSGVYGNAGQANYAASKAGVIGMTKSVAKEMGGRNVRVNAIAPGFIRTAMTDQLTEEVKNGMLAVIPLKRFGEAADVAEMVRFLASDASAYITGQVFMVDGGIMM